MGFFRDLIYQGTCNSDEQRMAEIHALSASGYTQKEALGLIRDMLTVLNSKASALLTFNAIALASLSIWASNTPVAGSSYLAGFHLALDVFYLMLLVSSLLCLFNVAVRWYLGAQVDVEQLLQYVRERDRRTIIHRWALLVAMCGVGALILASLLHILSVAGHATGLCVDDTGFFCAFAPMDFSG